MLSHVPCFAVLLSLHLVTFLMPFSHAFGTYISVWTIYPLFSSSPPFVPLLPPSPPPLAILNFLHFQQSSSEAHLSGRWLRSITEQIGISLPEFTVLFDLIQRLNVKYRHKPLHFIGLFNSSWRLANYSSIIPGFYSKFPLTFPVRHTHMIVATWCMVQGCRKLTVYIIRLR